MGTFGYATIGVNSKLITYYDPDAGVIHEIIAGSVFTIPEDGIAESITVALKTGVAHSQYAQCAIYRHSDLKKIAVTQDVFIDLTTRFQWFTFPFAAPKPTLTANTEYILVVWAEYATRTVYLAYDAGLTNQGHTQNGLVYNFWPDPLNPVHDNAKYSIYCTYSLPVVGVPRFIGDGLAGAVIIV